MEFFLGYIREPESHDFSIFCLPAGRQARMPDMSRQSWKAKADQVRHDEFGLIDSVQSQAI